MRERTRDTAADKYFVVSRILLHPTTSLRLVKCGDKRRVKYGDQHNYLSDIFTAKHIFTSLFQLCRVQGLCRLGLDFFSNGPENIYLHQTK